MTLIQKIKQFFKLGIAINGKPGKGDNGGKGGRAIVMGGRGTSISGDGGDQK